jgi:twitching motility protein PilI
MGALDELLGLQEATFRHAAPLPLKESAQPVWQGMGLQLGGLRLVSAMGEISEVLKLPKVAALPGVKSWVLGIANIRGRLIPVIDLHEFFDMTPTLPMAQWRVLVVDDGDLTAGLLVEQSLGIQHFLQESHEDVPGDALGTLAPYVRGAFRHGGRVYYEAQIRSIVRDEKFLNVARTTN